MLQREGLQGELVVAGEVLWEQQPAEQGPQLPHHQLLQPGEDVRQKRRIAEPRPGDSGMALDRGLY